MNSSGNFIKEQLALIAGVIILMFSFSGCAQNAPSETNQTALPTVAVAETATPTPAPSPTSMITPTPIVAPASTPTPCSVPLPPIPGNFIVADELWREAAFLRWTDEKLYIYKGVIFFPDIPVGTKLYAPMSGYIDMSVVRGDFGSHAQICIRELADWSETGPAGRYIIFEAQKFELLDVRQKDGQFFVEKDQAFANVTKSPELFPGTYEQKPEFMVNLDKDWADMIDDSIENPRAYAWQLFR